MRKFTKVQESKQYKHLSENPNETNEAWFRNKMSPILNLFTMSDEWVMDEKYDEIFQSEKIKALEMIELVKNAIKDL